VRIAHLGLGAFHRAHQAMYIARASDGADWGIRAFTNHSSALPSVLAGQDCLYTVVERGRDGDRLRIGTAIADARPGDDIAGWRAVCADQRTSMITLTVTEAGYRLRTGGQLNHDDPAVGADLAALSDNPADAAPATVVGRLALGLLERYGHDGPPIAVVSCDNLAGSGTRLREVVLEFTARLRPGLACWVERRVAFPSCVVDRITPATTSDDIAAVMAVTGIHDEATVVTEPRSEWIIEDLPEELRPEIPQPDLRSAGVTITTDLLPFEQRKLWMLNGAHTLLAFAGLLRAHATIADTFADAVCRSWVEQWWDVAARHVRLPAADVGAYRRGLSDRFGNPRIRHLVTQVAADPLAKLPVRVIPVLRRELDAGRLDVSAVRPVAAWLAATTDGRELTIDRVRAAVRALGAECAADDDQVVALVHATSRELRAAGSR
jgi:fructuronate reductase